MESSVSAVLRAKQVEMQTIRNSLYQHCRQLECHVPETTPSTSEKRWADRRLVDWLKMPTDSDSFFRVFDPHRSVDAHARLSGVYHTPQRRELIYTEAEVVENGWVATVEHPVRLAFLGDPYVAFGSHTRKDGVEVDRDYKILGLDAPIAIVEHKTPGVIYPDEWLHIAAPSSNTKRLGRELVR